MAGDVVLYPLAFSTSNPSPGAKVYLDHPAARALVEFFEHKGLAALKDEDQREHWYDDWLEYQSARGLYASLLSPAEFSARGNRFDLLHYARYLELFGYVSPAHGYSLQATFLGLFSILLGTNTPLKQEAIQILEAGGLFAFGVSEKKHGSDLLASEFSITKLDANRYVATGSKYYIGNSNCAKMISILARVENRPRIEQAHAGRRAPFAFFVLRPDRASAFRNGKKIRTLGVRSGYVGEFDVQEHPLASTDLFAEGRSAWDVLFGTVTLGKFFLSFGSIGICEHALDEALVHLRNRILYSKPATEIPHIRVTLAHAYARLTAMKLFAYRALDYVHAASESDRRYLLYCAVQKAKVSTDAVKVVALLSECIGARGFESDSYFEMALRDVQLFPGLEGSSHINLETAAGFIARYFGKADATLATPPRLASLAPESRENPYLMRAKTGGTAGIGFAHFLEAYRPLIDIPTVHAFTRQIKAFELFVRKHVDARAAGLRSADELAFGQCLATIAFAQLIAEHAVLAQVPREVVSVIFHLLIGDLSSAAIALASSPKMDEQFQSHLRRIIAIPRASSQDWDFVIQQATDP